MSTLCKIFAILSMACYLATSSIASAHAFPMQGSVGNSYQTAQIETISADESARQDQQLQETETLMACHQGASFSKDSSNAIGICKIFCSAIGHAFLLSQLTEISSNIHPSSPYSEINSLTTRQLTVEQQPPK